jgi:hypothetical protein
MSDPVTYSFYGTTIPALRNTVISAIAVLNAAKEEKATVDTLPSEQEMLDAKFEHMLPFRLQPILLAKFSIAALDHLKLNGSAPIPEFSPEFASFDAVIEYFQKVQAVFDAVDEKAFNESALKGVDIPVGGKTLHMTALADYFHSFVVPNSYFHLNAMYMLLKSKGFKLSKSVYIGPWITEQQGKDWAPLKA